MEPFKIALETLMRGKQDWEHTDYLNNKGRAFSFPKSRENSFSQGSHTDFLNSSESVFIHAGFFFFFLKACIYLVIKFQILKHSQAQSDKSSLWTLA